MEINDKFDMLLRMLEEFERKREEADQRRRAARRMLKSCKFQLGTSSAK
jgi:hypothetical protein